jgi:hypothetical protein
MAIACPVRLQGVIGCVYYFDATLCSNGSAITANDTRDHTLGVSCSNVLDPIFVPGPSPVLGPDLLRGRTRGAVRGAARGADTSAGPFGCGCAYTGLKTYTTLQSTVMVAPGFDITAEHIVQYVDKNADGHYVERLARLFVLKGGGPRKKPVLIGQEMAPGTRVSGVLEGELKRPFGHYHTVMTGKGLAHIVTKSYLQPVPEATRGNGASRGRRARSKGKKRTRK